MHSTQTARLDVAAAHRHRLLIAEDDRALREMLVALFRADGHEVVVVTNGIDLLDTLEVSMDPALGLRKFDLAISDIRMPGTSGLRVFERLRCGRNTPPVVFMTAFGDEELHEEAHHLGALAVLDKPFDLDELRAFVNRFLEAKHAADGVRGSTAASTPC